MLVKSLTVSQKVRLYAALATIGITASIVNGVVYNNKVVVRTMNHKTVEFIRITDIAWQASINQKEHYGISDEDTEILLVSLISSSN